MTSLVLALQRLDQNKLQRPVHSITVQRESWDFSCVFTPTVDRLLTTGVFCIGDKASCAVTEHEEFRFNVAVKSTLVISEK